MDFARLIFYFRESESELESDSHDEQDENIDDSGSENEQEQPSARPYMALLNSFHESSAHKAKRRKLEHNVSSEHITPEESDENMDDSEGEEPDDIDEVDGAEDEEKEGEQQEDEPDSEDDEDVTDPFDTHYAHPDDSQVGKAVNAVKNNGWTTSRALVHTLRATMMTVDSEDSGSGKAQAPQPCGLEGLKVKQKLQEMAAKKMDELDATERSILPLLFGYKDIFYCDRTVKNAGRLRQVVCLHALNHVFK